MELLDQHIECREKIAVCLFGIFYWVNNKNRLLDLKYVYNVVRKSEWEWEWSRDEYRDRDRAWDSKKANKNQKKGPREETKVSIEWCVWDLLIDVCMCSFVLISEKSIHNNCACESECFETISMHIVYIHRHDIRHDTVQLFCIHLANVLFSLKMTHAEIDTFLRLLFGM